MEDVEDQLGNFKDFRRFMQDFATRSDERAKHRAEKETEEKEARDKKDQRRATLHFSLLGGVISLIVGLILWLVQWTGNFEKRHHVTENSVTQSQQSTHAKDE